MGGGALMCRGEVRTADEPRPRAHRLFCELAGPCAPRSACLPTSIAVRTGISQERAIVRKPSIDSDRGRAEEPGKERELLQVIRESVGHRNGRYVGSR